MAIKKGQKKKKTPFLTKTLRKLVPKVGATILIEPGWQYAAQLRFKNGSRKYLRYYSLDLNTVAASEIAKDKDFAKFFMKKMGYPVAESQLFFKPDFAKKIGSKSSVERAKAYAKRKGYPIIVKPNSQSQGTAVALVHNERELIAGLHAVFTQDRSALLEEYRPGHDYRIVVVDDKVISAYERTPLSVVGDGHSSILALLHKKQKLFIENGRDTRLDFNDHRIVQKLTKQKLKLQSILSKGEKVSLLDNANLSDGGDSVDVTETIHDKYKKLAVSLTRDMGLRMAGVDLMIEQGTIDAKPIKDGFYVIEINATPGLDHYASTGKKQQKIVEDMYLAILKSLAKK